MAEEKGDNQIVSIGVDQAKFEEFRERCGEFFDQIVPKLRRQNNPPKAIDLTCSLMQKRMMASMNSLSALYTLNPNEHVYDLYTILRSMYDLHLQFLYVLKDPIQHSIRYINFGALDRFKFLNAVDHEDSRLGKAMRVMQTYAKHKQQITDDYDRLKSDFEYVVKGKNGKKDEKKVRSHWYDKANLAEVAKAVGYHSEYSAMHKVLSGYVHSASDSLWSDSLPIESAIVDGMRLTIRVVGKIAKYQNVQFDEFQQGMYDLSLRSLA